MGKLSGVETLMPTLCGDRNDKNGRVIEEFIEEEELVCINDGTGTRLDIARGTESAIDITIVTKDIAVESDHYPIKNSKRYRM